MASTRWQVRELYCQFSYSLGTDHIKNTVSKKCAINWTPTVGKLYTWKILTFFLFSFWQNSENQTSYTIKLNTQEFFIWETLYKIMLKQQLHMTPTTNKQSRDLKNLILPYLHVCEKLKHFLLHLGWAAHGVYSLADSYKLVTQRI
jgi:hypothetical protein